MPGTTQVCILKINHINQALYPCSGHLLLNNRLLLRDVHVPWRNKPTRQQSRQSEDKSFTCLGDR